MLRKTKSTLLAALVAGVMGCDDSDDDAMINGGDGNGEDTREVSRAYIDLIVPHHEMAVMMADEALAKAVHSGLKEMARKMKDEQTREIELFKEIRRNLLGSDTTPLPMRPNEMPAGEMFDKMFLHQMIDHHQGAIDQSVLASGAGVAGPLDSLADHIIEAQRGEQKDLNDSLHAWYGETHRIGDGPRMDDMDTTRMMSRRVLRRVP